MDRLDGRVRPRAHDLHDRAAALRDLGKKCRIDRVVARGEVPVLAEEPLHVRDRGAVDAQVHVAPRQEHLPDVDATDEAGLTVDDQELAMVAQVRRPSAADRIEREELRDAPAGDDDRPEEAAHVGRARAEAVEQDAHSHAPRARSEQRLAEAQAHGVGLKDVALEVNVIPRCVDGGELRGVRLLGTEEHAHDVARGDRWTAHPTREAHHVALLRRLVGQQRLERIVAWRARQGADALSKLPVEGALATDGAAHAVPTEEPEQQHADRREEQQRHDPRDRARRLFAADQHERDERERREADERRGDLKGSRQLELEHRRAVPAAGSRSRAPRARQRVPRPARSDRKDAE